MAVAAAIGVTAGGDSVNENSVSNISSRIGLKSKKAKSSKLASTSASATSGVGELNRSIEKMTIQNADQDRRHSSSNWMGTTTNSTQAATGSEGYASMPSSASSMLSRRCSELSQASSAGNASTRANLSSPVCWENSNSNSSTSQHLERLQRKAHQQMQQQQQQHYQHLPTSDHHQMRRASDPVKSLDRNFGVHHPRRASYGNNMANNTNSSQQQQQLYTPQQGMPVRKL